MKKKLFAMLLTATMIGTLLTGCGSNTSKASEEEAGTGEKTKMTVSCLTGGNNEKYAALIQKEIDEFNSTNEYNVELVMEAYSNEQYKTKITTLMASNAQPDIFFTFESGFLQPFVEGGKVYPISDAIEADPEWDALYTDKSVFGPVTFDGKYYAVPNTRQIVTITYNKKLFSEAGVEVPTTYSEFLEVCEALKQIGKTPFLVPCQEAWYAGQLMQQLANGIGGTALFEGTSDGTVSWNDAQYVEAGTKLSGLVEKGYLPEGFLGMTPNEAFAKFNNGEAGMVMNLTSAITMFNSQDNPIYDDIDFFVMPTDNEENQGVNVGSTGQMYAVSNQAEDVDAACAFVKQLTGTRFQQELVNQGQMLVCDVDVDRANVDEMALRMQKVFEDVSVYTPWLDRVFGAGEGVEFNNAAVAIMAGGSPQEKMDDLQQFSEDNKSR